MNDFPYIFTFYSYKGGVGRSMALLNTAYTLAGWGRHVLIVDMDLEAPGISSFLKRHQELAPTLSEHKLDILTLLGEIIAGARAGKSSKDIAAELPELSEFIRGVASDKLTTLAPRAGAVGRLDVVAADMDRNWCGRLAALGLADLSQDQLIKASSALHFYFKAHRFQDRPFGLEDFEPAQPTPYDYILVDSRTGITEVGGLCVGPLADRLVVLSALNDQNIEGTLSFLKEAGIETGHRGSKSPRWDDADIPTQAEAPALGPKPTILVASPVPNGEIDFKKKRLAELEERVGIRPARLSYHPQMALFESVFVRDYRDEYLAREYLDLAGRITRQVADHHVQILSRTQKDGGGISGVELIDSLLRIASSEPDLGLSLLSQFASVFKPKSDSEFLAARRMYATLAGVGDGAHAFFSNWGSTLGNHAKTKRGEAADRLFAESYTKFAEAVRLKPDLNEALSAWGATLGRHANTKRGEDADRLFGDAYAKYAEAVSIKPDAYKAFFNWGVTLGDHANVKLGEDADRLFTEAYAKFAEAVRLKPDMHEALVNWGLTLGDHANIKLGEDADCLFAEAYAKFAEAVRLKPEDHEAWSHWGAILGDQADTKKTEDMHHLFEKAYDKFAEAVRLKPDFGEAFSGWGAALGKQAKTKQGEDADRLFAEAYGKFAEGVRLKPDSSEAFSAWGATLGNQASIMQGESADHLFAEAYDKFTEAVRLNPDGQLTFSAWGATLGIQATTKQGGNVDSIFAEAYAKFAEAVRLKPGDHQTWSNWGVTLCTQAKAKQGEGVDRLWDEAAIKLMAAEKIQPGSAAYNLACLAALKKHPSEAIRWLNVAIARGEKVTVKSIAEDRDFDSLRKEGAFSDFVSILPLE